MFRHRKTDRMLINKCIHALIKKQFRRQQMETTDIHDTRIIPVWVFFWCLKFK